MISEEDLSKIIEEYGEEKFAKKIASNIVKERQKKTIETKIIMQNDNIKMYFLSFISFIPIANILSFLKLYYTMPLIH